MACFKEHNRAKEDNNKECEYEIAHVRLQVGMYLLQEEEVDLQKQFDQ